MIHLAITDATVKQLAESKQWIVRHPSNDAILAYCDTEEEARHARDAINDLPRVLREVGRKVL